MRETIPLACAMQRITSEVLHAQDKRPGKMESPHVAYALMDAEMHKLCNQLDPYGLSSHPDQVRVTLVRIAAVASRALVDLDLV